MRSRRYEVAITMDDIKKDIQEALDEKDLKRFTDLLIKLDTLEESEIREWAYKKGDEAGIFDVAKLKDYEKIASDAIKDGTEDVMMAAIEQLTDERSNLEMARGRFIMQGKLDLAVAAERRWDFAADMIDRIESVYIKKYVVEKKKPTPAEMQRLQSAFGKGRRGMRGCTYCKKVVGDDYIVREGAVYHQECYEIVRKEQEGTLNICSLCGKEFGTGRPIDIVPGTRREFAHKECIDKAGLK